jgi:hypothetical protein
MNVAFQHAFAGIIYLVVFDQFNVRRDIVFGAKSRKPSVVDSAAAR